MISELAKPFNKASIALNPDDVLLKKGSWVRFTNAWPTDQNLTWASGNTFEVSLDPVLTPYPVSFTLQNGDYQYLDLSNMTVPTPGTPLGTTGSLQAYPAKTGVLYQIGIGMKPGNYFLQLYIPKGQYIYTVGSPNIFPDITNQYFRYLGAKYPKDSPFDSPLWYLYAIYAQPAFILAPFVDGVDFDKINLVFFINKCVLSQITDPVKLKQAQDKSLLVEYYTEEQSF